MTNDLIKAMAQASPSVSPTVIKLNPQLFSTLLSALPSKSLLPLLTPVHVAHIFSSLNLLLLKGDSSVSSNSRCPNLNLMSSLSLRLVTAPPAGPISCKQARTRWLGVQGLGEKGKHLLATFVTCEASEWIKKYISQRVLQIKMKQCVRSARDAGRDGSC